MAEQITTTTIKKPYSHINIPKPPQDAEFSVSQGLNIKALICKNGNPF